MGSSRLPGKILYPLGGRPLLAVLAQRLVRSARVDEWWLATTDRADDEVTAGWGAALGLRVCSGAVEDVLSRFVAIARERNPTWIVRATADNPFADGAVVDAMLAQTEQMPASSDCLSEDRTNAALPLGYAPEIVRAEALLEAEAAIPDAEPHHRAHVTSWLVACGRRWPFQPPADWPARPAWRWTVDTLADARMADQAFALFGERWPTISYPEMVAALDAQPDLVALNAEIQQKPVEAG